METLLTIGAFFMAFSFSFISIPSIVKVAHTKHLFDPVDDRKIHKHNIPPLGGVAVFIGFILSSFIVTNGYVFPPLKYISAAVIVLLFIGLKDDLLDISARKKLLVQLFAAIMLITMGDIRFTNLHGIFGLHEISYLTSFSLSLLAITGIINAYNLIDGVDGLASGLGILTSTFFGVWFYLNGDYSYAILSLALSGSLSAFFIYNVFGKSNKMFLGDTGSLILGCIVAVLTVQFNELNIAHSSAVALNAAPAVSLAVIIVPLVDTMRVMTMRILKGLSPFTPDRNHIHHRLLDVMQVHIKVTVTLVFSNLVLIGIALLLGISGININFQFALVFLIALGGSFIPSLLLKRTKAQKSTPKLSLFRSFKSFFF